MEHGGIPERPGGVALLDAWIEREHHIAAQGMMRSVSATGLVKERPKFGQVIRPLRGSVLASPERASYDPEPDYFFHWLRDSALVMDALRLLLAEGTLAAGEIEHFHDFVSFSLGLSRLSGPEFLAREAAPVDPDYACFLRPPGELCTLTGDRVLGESRYNPDGTLDALTWSRPQTDGPATRVLAVLRFREAGAAAEPDRRAAMDHLLRQDLDFLERHWPEASYDIWEEESGHHYYTRLVQHAALTRGAAFARAQGENEAAGRYHDAATELRARLDRHWRPEGGFYASCEEAAGSEAGKDRDMAVILGVLHAGSDGRRHGLLDPRVQATMGGLVDLFRAEFPINRSGPGAEAPAMGRYHGDAYYGGGAWFVSTLGAAEFHYALAERVVAGAVFEVGPENEGFIGGLFKGEPEQGTGLARALLARGDAFMVTVRAYAPTSGALAEQFDKVTGAPASARHLAWSYAAFITAREARKRVLARMA